MRVIVVIIVACESGNKLAFKQLSDELETENYDSHLHLLYVLPDLPHVVKRSKASFANWHLKFANERGNLSLVCSLRNMTAANVTNKMRKIIRINDYMRNRDEQNPRAVLAFCNQTLLQSLKEMGRAVKF